MSVVLEKELPKGWIITTLPFIVKNERYAIKRGPFGSHLKKQFFVESGYKVYEQQHVIKNNFSLGDYYIEEKKFQELKNFVIKAGDVLISCSGTVGEIAIVPKEFEKGIINQALLKISLDPLIVETKFFISLFIFWMLKARIDSHGSSMRNLSSVKELKKLPISLPPLNEQKRIVAKIEELFSLVDSAKENLEKTKLLLKQYRQSILKHAFEGKLVPQDPNDEPASVLLEKIKKENPSQKTSNIVLEKELPMGWTVVNLESISDLIGGGTPSRNNLEYFGGNIIWLTPTEIPKDRITRVSDSKEKITKLGLMKSSAKMIPKNSVLLTSRASIGYVAIADNSLTTNQGFSSFVCHEPLYNFFLAYWLWGNKKELESNATGTTFKEISKSKLRVLSIPLPPLNEQKRIVAKIEESFSIIEKNEKLVDSLLLQYNQIKNSILKQAFEGKLVPQDPNDEPAQILLEKIQQERKKNGK